MFASAWRYCILEETFFELRTPPPVEKNDQTLQGRRDPHHPKERSGERAPLTEGGQAVTPREERASRDCKGGEG